MRLENLGSQRFHIAVYKELPRSLTLRALKVGRDLDGNHAVRVLNGFAALDLVDHILERGLDRAWHLCDPRIIGKQLQSDPARRQLRGQRLAQSIHHLLLLLRERIQ